MDYDSPKWAQKILLAIIIGGLLSLVTALAHAETGKFTMTCDSFQSNDRVRCEFRGLTEYTIHWKVYVNGRMAQHEVGHVVYMTLDTEWRVLKLSYMTTYTEVVIFDGYIRWNGKNAVFGQHT